MTDKPPGIRERFWRWAYQVLDALIPILEDAAVYAWRQVRKRREIRHLGRPAANDSERELIAFRDAYRKYADEILDRWES